ncbi:hypothetical protein [Sodalis glossinidius]|uniref:hypothetical protein n=1 Tax=Sodalis glossinidius TaxID=63612 RepID=UPI001FB162AD|nr:hypothetical protein [Sodalis glossinidius]
MQILTPVGIDVASQKFDVAVWKGKAAYKSKAFSNTPKGFDALKKWLEPFGDCLYAWKQQVLTVSYCLLSWLI